MYSTPEMYTYQLSVSCNHRTEWSVRASMEPGGHTWLKFPVENRQKTQSHALCTLHWRDALSEHAIGMRIILLVYDVSEINTTSKSRRSVLYPVSEVVVRRSGGQVVCLDPSR